MTAADFREQLFGRAAAARVRISALQADQFERYCRLLAHWGPTINLTALRLEPPSNRAIDRLFIEPVVAARSLSRPPTVWFDIGSGNGSPAIPLRIAGTSGRLTLVESRERRAAFLREAIRELALDDVDVKTARIERIAAEPQTAGTADLVTLRAVRIDATLLEAIRALLRLGGQALLLGAAVSQVAVPKGLEVELVSRGAPSGGLVLLNRIE